MPCPYIHPLAERSRSPRGSRNFSRPSALLREGPLGGRDDPNRTGIVEIRNEQAAHPQRVKNLSVKEPKQERVRFIRKNRISMENSLTSMSSAASRYVNTEILGDPKGRTITQTTVDGFKKLGIKRMNAVGAHSMMIAGATLPIVMKNWKVARVVGILLLASVAMAYVMGRME